MVCTSPGSGGGSPQGSGYTCTVPLGDTVQVTADSSCICGLTQAYPFSYWNIPPTSRDVFSQSTSFTVSTVGTYYATAQFACP